MAVALAAAVALLAASVPEPRAIAVPAVALPTVALRPTYCAETSGAQPTPPPAISTAAAIATADLLRLPLAFVNSDTATHAPKDSFQILRYDLFIEDSH